MKPSGVGGMAVIEGVMMKNKDKYAVAVRKPDNEIVVELNTQKNFADKVKIFKLPIFRGMLAFVDSLVTGMKVLNFSSSFFDEEEDEISVTDSKKAHKKEKEDSLLMVAAVILSIVISIALFMVLPVLISSLFSGFITTKFSISLLEGIIRLTIFIIYILAASQMKEIKRVFMYHGAEHKTINCLENGFELTIENVKWQSRRHKRCGTSFMLLVMVISLIFFLILPTRDLVWKIISRIVLVPVIAGISYEFIRLAGKSDNFIVNLISKPGLLLQGITTKEPDDDMIEVAIASVEAVFDWRGFLESEKSDKETVNAIDENVDSSESVESISNSESINKIDGINNESIDDNNDNISKDEELNHDILDSDDEEDDDILKALDRYLK